MSAEPRREVEVITLGCRLNAFESEVVRRLAREGGLENAVVVNTCAVTAEAERQARQAIRRARRDHPGAHLIVTGCAAQIAPAKFAAMPEVDRVLGNVEKLDPAEYAPARFAPEANARIAVADIQSAAATETCLIEGFEGRVRAFLQVQQGCDQHCTFCVIPLGRGASRSVPFGRIVAQARKLAANGYAEFVLTGVDLASYGADLPGRPTLGSMVRRLLERVPEIRRLRFSSLDPAGIDDELKHLVAAEERVMPHLHLSLQSGDDMILRRMKRRHRRGDAVDLCREMKYLRPQIVFGADLVAGFPTETEEMFENTLSLIEACGVTYLHVFPYSPRPGTPAARLPQLPGPCRKARAARLREAGEAALRRFLESRVGTRVSVLVEHGRWGHSETFAPVRLDRDVAAGRIVGALVTGLSGRNELAARVEAGSGRGKAAPA